MMQPFFVILVVMFSASYSYAEELSLKQLIELAYSQNPELESLQQKIQSTQESAKAKSALSDPMIGVSELKRGNTTRYWTVGQKIEFPTKYGLREDIQTSKASSLVHALEQKKLSLRAKIITAYYGIYAVQKIKSLTLNDLDKIKEFSRIAETKYAAGTAHMQDSMKAHFTQTQVEADLIALRQEEDILQAKLAATLGKSPPFAINIGHKELPVPKLTGTNFSQLSLEVEKSPSIKQKQEELKGAKLENTLAKWQYAPDFQFRYQGYLSGMPEDAQMITFEMSVPLWFWGKSADERATALNRSAKEYELTAVKQNLDADVATFGSRVKNQSELLDIFKTSLVPQAVTSFESSMDAYKANKITFLELLDSERSLLKVQIASYRTLTQYIDSLTQLEASVGHTVSGLGN